MKYQELLSRSVIIQFLTKKEYYGGFSYNRILDHDIIVDTSFFFQEDVILPISISLNEVEESYSKVIEYILLDTVAFTIARSPDGGKWVQSDNYTIGSKNNVSESYYKDDLLPELFVIYQNYPNPFNSQTKDFIRPA